MRGSASTQGPDDSDVSHGPEELLSVSEMSGRTGVAPSALRFYEELGLISS